MMTNDDLSDRPEAGLRSVETQGGDERISIHEVIAEVIADAYRAGQEAMRERCASRSELIERAQALLEELRRGGALVRLQADLAVAQGEAWQCQECFAVYHLSRNPIYGEYPEEGDVFCSDECLRQNDARGDEAPCGPGVQP